MIRRLVTQAHRGEGERAQKIRRAGRRDVNYRPEDRVSQQAVVSGAESDAYLSSLLLMGSVEFNSVASLNRVRRNGDRRMSSLESYVGE